MHLLLFRLWLTLVAYDMLASSGTDPRFESKAKKRRRYFPDSRTICGGARALPTGISEWGWRGAKTFARTPGRQIWLRDLARAVIRAQWLFSHPYINARGEPQHGNRTSSPATFYQLPPVMLGSRTNYLASVCRSRM